MRRATGDFQGTRVHKDLKEMRYIYCSSMMHLIDLDTRDSSVTKYVCYYI